MIFCKSERAAQRTLEHIKPFIERKLFLKLNEKKTKVSYIAHPDLKFLGFGFWASKNGYKCCPHRKSKLKCKQRLRELTSRSRGQSLDTFRQKLKEFICGWVNYFKYSSMSTFIKQTDEWLRRRIRQLYWKQWKKTGTKYAALVKLGVGPSQAWQWQAHENRTGARPTAGYYTKR